MTQVLLFSALLVCCHGFTILSPPKARDTQRRYLGIVKDEEKVPNRSSGELASELFRLGVPYFRETNEGKWSLGKVIGLTLLQSGVSVAISYISRDFYNSLSAKDLVQFQQILIKFGGALVVAVPVTVFYRYEREQLSLNWRKWMTKDILEKYAQNQKYYQIEENNAGDEVVQIDNPDQRITQDIDSFTAVSLSFGITALTSVIDLFSFSSILYSIYPPLFGAIVAYATLGTGLTAYVGRDLSKQNFAALRSEADFRYALIRLRENAEAIAFYNGAKREEILAKERLNTTVLAQNQIITTQRNLEFITVAYRFLVQILPIAVVAPLYFQNKVELGIVTQSSSAFNHVLNDFSQIINQFESIAAFGAGLDRLSTFVSKLEDKGTIENIAIIAHDLQQPDSVLITEDLEVRTPDNRRILVADLNLKLRKGQRLILVGASGTGKSSLLRALAGLWQPTKGRVALPPDAFFLPQKPYCTLGTLADQLLYPRSMNPDDNINYDELTQALIDVGLKRLVPQLNQVTDWTNTLSLGEQQRLAFARLILARPSLVVADEATSALDVDAERYLYNLLQTRLGPDLALVSVGHRPSLLEHHDLRLRLPTLPDDDQTRTSVLRRPPPAILGTCLKRRS